MMAERKLSEATGSNVDPTLIQACLAEYSRLDTDQKRLAQEVTALFTRYEAQGVKRRSIKVAHKASKLDKAEARAQAASDARYLVITGILNPADDGWVRALQQSDLFSPEEAAHPAVADGEIGPKLATARAYNDGYNSGRHGAERNDNPFTAGAAEYVEWDKGARDGLADRAQSGKTKPKVADTTVRKPGRPAGSGRKAREEAPAEAAD
jgi:ribosome modulation factor